MPIQSTDHILISRGGTLYKEAVSALQAGGALPAGVEGQVLGYGAGGVAAAQYHPATGGTLFVYPGRYVSMFAMGTAGSTSVDYTDFTPFMLSRRTVVNRLAIRTNTAVTTRTVRLGIYSVGINSASLLRDGGTFNASANGLNELVIPNTVVEPGTYLFAFHGGGGGVLNITGSSPLLGSINTGGFGSGFSREAPGVPFEPTISDLQSGLSFGHTPWIGARFV